MQPFALSSNNQVPNYTSSETLLLLWSLIEIYVAQDMKNIGSGQELIKNVNYVGLCESFLKRECKEIVAEYIYNFIFFCPNASQACLI